MTCFAALCLALSACARINRTVDVTSPDVPTSLLVCGDETSPTKDGIPAPPKQPYDQREVAAYIVKLKAIIRECHGNTKAVQKLLDEFQDRFDTLKKAGA